MNHKKNNKAHFIKTKFTIHYPIKTNKTHILKHRKKEENTNTKFKKRRKSEKRQAGRHTSREQPMVVTTAAVT